MTVSEIREHPNYARIKNSAEFKNLKREILILGAILGTWSLFMILALAAADFDAVLNSARGAKLGMSLVLWIVMILGFAGYYTYRLWELFWHIDRYTFTQALMDKPHQGYKGSMYFTVEVMDRQGNRIKRDTRKIFGQWDPNFEEYLNKTALIGYNDETDTVVVIGLTGA